ncbi:MAG: DNA polymerase IV [Thaumarchaeota archaeon]|nr:DNA polymerase IV [Nitrososphaerota archaeon]
MSQHHPIIFHVDIDAFYASVEAREAPELRGLPVVIGADPEGGRGRGVVVACSYEARKFGLKSGMPISRAYKLCPSATYLRPNFTLYARASSRVMQLLRRHADKFEQVGIDEAFLDVSSRVRDAEPAKELAMQIKKELRDGEGFTCSIGIAPNKSSAKIGSDLQKPDGLTLVPFDAVGEFLARLPVSVIPGVGKKTREFLKERGIETIAQLQDVSGKQLVKWFGKGGVWLWGVAQGKEQMPVRAREVPKSLNVERTFRRDVREFKQLFGVMDEIAYELNRRLRVGELRFKKVGIKIRFTHFETHTREKMLGDYSDELDLIQRTARSLLHEFSGRKESVRLLGVRVSELRRERAKASTLDSWARS